MFDKVEVALEHSYLAAPYLSRDTGILIDRPQAHQSHQSIFDLWIDLQAKTGAVGLDCRKVKLPLGLP